MRVPAYIRRAIRKWVSWRAENRIRRAIPELAALMLRRDVLRRQHRSVARTDALIRRIMTERLRLELSGRRA